MALAIGPSGLTIDTADEILAAQIATAEATFGASIQAGNGNAVIGQLLSGQTQELLAMQEGLDGVYQSGFLDGAAGVNLDRLAEDVGLNRLPAVATVVAGLLHNTAGAPVTVPIGALFQLVATGATFATIAATVVGAGASVAASLRAIETGPQVVGITVAAGWTILTPFAGSTTITFANTVAGVTGTDQEIDADFRLRIEQSAHLPGRTTLDAIRAAIRAVAGVVQASVFENPTDILGILTPVIIAGLPKHSFVAVVRGGDSVLIATAIFQNKAAGIETYGGTTVNLIDTDGYTVPTKFQTAAATTVAIVATLLGLTHAQVLVQTAAINAAVEAYMATRGMGQLVIFDAVLGAIFTNAGPDCVGVTLTINGAAANFAVAWDHYPLTVDADITLLP